MLKPSLKKPQTLNYNTQKWWTQLTLLSNTILYIFIHSLGWATNSSWSYSQFQQSKYVLLAITGESEKWLWKFKEDGERALIVQVSLFKLDQLTSILSDAGPPILLWFLFYYVYTRMLHEVIKLPQSCNKRIITLSYDTQRWINALIIHSKQTKMFMWFSQ